MHRSHKHGSRKNRRGRVSTFDKYAASKFGLRVDWTLCWSRAGVAGLTTALLLAKESKYQITVAAKHMPGVIILLT